LNILLGIGEGFIGSIAAFWLLLHVDFEGWFHQRRIRRGEKMDARRG
jgi:hypothetical protein